MNSVFFFKNLNVFSMKKMQRNFYCIYQFISADLENFNQLIELNLSIHTQVIRSLSLSLSKYRFQLCRNSSAAILHAIIFCVEVLLSAFCAPSLLSHLSSLWYAKIMTITGTNKKKKKRKTFSIFFALQRKRVVK